MRPRSVIGLLGLVGSVIFACSGKNSQTACPAGQSVACNCQGTSTPGAQVCKSDGSGFEACNCLGATAATGGATSGTMSSTSSLNTSTGTSPPGSVGSTGAGGANPNLGKCDKGDKTNTGCQTCQNSACALAFCQDKVSKCMANAECKAIQDCISKCAQNDGACFNACVSAHMMGTTDMFNMFICTICNPGPCYGDCQGSPQTCSQKM